MRKNIIQIFVASLLALGFIGVVAFGAFAMDFVMKDNGHDHDGCIAATVQGRNCPGWQNTLSVLIFHLDAFRGFSTAVFSNYFVNALLWLFGLMSLAVFGFLAGMLPMAPEFAAHYCRMRVAGSSVVQAQSWFAHWLALHENSPSFV